MKVKICSFEEAVKICEKPNTSLTYAKWEDKMNTAYGIPRKWDKWGEVTSAYLHGGYYRVDYFDVPPEFVTPIDSGDLRIDEFDVIHYGTIIIDNDIEDCNGNFVSIMIIAYEGSIYYHKMVNGVVVEFKMIGVSE